ncbi:MAG: hypothetical protein IPK23_11875 [Rhizobiales bacterium]|jgi:hypothetical protein|nr:hypothetical protein [Hyphomicrobiales bacterium]
MGPKRLLLALGVALLIPIASIASAEDITFGINNDSDHDIQIEFYSQDRSHAWPGGDQAYNLSAGDENSYKLSCRSGEKICYGAWVKGKSSTYWGVGLNNKQSCSACCQTCGDGDLKRTLTNPE